MRSSLLAALLALSASAFSQMSGVYQPAHGSNVQWSIDAYHNLLWNGQPYVPVGLHINGTTDEIAGAKKAGIGDVIVDLPPSGTQWTDAIKSLESSGMRYILSIDSLLPPAKGFSVQPEAYRIDGITSDQHVHFALPGAVSALVVLVTQRDASVQSFVRVPIQNGQFDYDVKTKTDLEEVLLVYPEQTVATHPDYWDGFDAQRDVLLASLQANKPGPGLRGILNPLGRMFRTDFGSGLFVPESPFYRDEMAAYLEAKYRNVETAARSWALGTNDLQTFADMAKLVPLWSGPRGVGEVWNTATDMLYPCEQRHSAMWNDIRMVVAQAAAKRFERLVPAIQSVVDVPILQDWTGWVAPFEAATPELSGVGYGASGTDEQDLINDASRPTSSVMRWNKPGWIVCTSLNLKASAQGGSGLREILDDLESMGTRGIFLKEVPSSLLPDVANDAQRRATDTASADAPVLPVYFPENAFNPVLPKRLDGGKWWLPSPEDGNRVDFGFGFYGYQYTDGNNYTTVIWTTNPPGNVKLDMLTGKTSSFARVDGQEIKPRVGRDSVEVPLDSVPLTITNSGEVPVPDPCAIQTIARFSQLLSIAETFHADVTEDDMFFKDSIANFRKDPSSTFLALRKKFLALNVRLGKFSWIEGESTRDTNFSEILPLSGCSDGAVLILHTPITTDPKGFYAKYQPRVRSSDDQEVWIAARIPPEFIKDVSVQVADQNLTIIEGPVSSYGQGYAWYRLGTTKLSGTGTSVVFRVNSPEGAYVALDAILITPGHFVPNGITPPDAIAFQTPTVKKRR